MIKTLKNKKLAEFADNTTFIYIAYITLACVFTSELNIIHTRFLLGADLNAVSFITPALAGVMFGYLLARIKLMGDQLKEQAFTDALTGIYNRLHFNRLLDSEIERIKRYGGQLSIIFFDIDHFKQINDTHGHPTGDAVLQELANVVSSANRSSDIFARYGGEEFIIMASSTKIDGAMEHSQRLKQDIEQHRFTVGRVTASFGVTEFISASDDMNTLLERSDKALYQAKSDGRNCVRQL